jgi:hypothetical protein
VNAPDENAVAKEVLRIQERDGVCTPAAFVEEAQDETSPLHDLFEWDDTVEAQKWREHKARTIIGRVRIVVNGTRTPAHVAVTITQGERTRSGYVPVEVAMSRDDLREQVFAQAIAGLAGWRRRLAAFQEAADAVSLIGEAIDLLLPEAEEEE